MINIRSIYFVLFLLLITGGSAALAKNDYGVQLMAWSFVGYALTSALAGILSIFERRISIEQTIENFTLFVIFSIISMRIVLIRFPYVEIVFSIAGLILVILYGKHLIKVRNGIGNKVLSYFLMLFYGSIVLYLLALVLNPMNKLSSEILAILGLIILVIAILSSFRIRSIVIKEKEVSLSKYLTNLPNNSMVIISLLLIYTIYSATVMTKIIPDIHSNNMPEGYYELIKKAEAGTDLKVDGQFQYEIYKEHLDRFYKNQGLED